MRRKPGLARAWSTTSRLQAAHSTEDDRKSPEHLFQQALIRGARTRSTRPGLDLECGIADESAPRKVARWPRRGLGEGAWWSRWSSTTIIHRRLRSMAKPPARTTGVRFGAPELNVKGPAPPWQPFMLALLGDVMCSEKALSLAPGGSRLVPLFFVPGRCLRARGEGPPGTTKGNEAQDPPGTRYGPL